MLKMTLKLLIQAVYLSAAHLQGGRRSRAEVTAVTAVETARSSAREAANPINLRSVMLLMVSQQCTC
jgi:hypothetical protein